MTTKPRTRPVRAPASRPARVDGRALASGRSAEAAGVRLPLPRDRRTRRARRGGRRARSGRYRPSARAESHEGGDGEREQRAVRDRILAGVGLERPPRRRPGARRTACARSLFATRAPTVSSATPIQSSLTRAAPGRSALSSERRGPTSPTTACPSTPGNRSIRSTTRTVTRSPPTWSGRSPFESAAAARRGVARTGTGWRSLGTRGRSRVTTWFGQRVGDATSVEPRAPDPDPVLERQAASSRKLPLAAFPASAPRSCSRVAGSSSSPTSRPARASRGSAARSVPALVGPRSTRRNLSRHRAQLGQRAAPRHRAPGRRARGHRPRGGCRHRPSGASIARHRASPASRGRSPSASAQLRERRWRQAEQRDPRLAFEPADRRRSTRRTGSTSAPARGRGGGSSGAASSTGISRRRSSRTTKSRGTA